MAREKVIPAVAQKVLTEEIHAYTVHPGGVSVAIGLMENGEWALEQQFETLHLGSLDVAAMMSADGGGKIPGKPAGTFRKDDLWPFIDAARAKGS